LGLIFGGFLRQLSPSNAMQGLPAYLFDKAGAGDARKVCKKRSGHNG